MGVPWIWLPEPAYGLPAGFSLLELPRDMPAFFAMDISAAGQIHRPGVRHDNPRTRTTWRQAALWRNGTGSSSRRAPARTPWELIYAESIVYTDRTTRIAGYGSNWDATDINGFDPASRGYVLT